MSRDNIRTIRCTKCKIKNKIPLDKAGAFAKCGKCSSPLDTSDLLNQKPVIVTDDNFGTKVLNSPIPVLLDCWAPWCGPCKMIGPVMEELAAEYCGKIRICKLNVDENPATSSRFQISSIPSMLIFDKGELKDTIVGAVPKQQITGKISTFIL
ncbi:MAG: thioredoxin TrxC [Desulfobacterium sp.]|nr:thioredoxin TrxC [Desulfobacterium sp.]MBU3947472.1 thioredoxin TrxC [Pseudomonadota bacterium]MBU4036971.1 thioredoxin TrxC [Pseudomonadota bacterium]